MACPRVGLAVTPEGLHAEIFPNRTTADAGAPIEPQNGRRAEWQFRLTGAREATHARAVYCFGSVFSGAALELVPVPEGVSVIVFCVSCGVECAGVVFESGARELPQPIAPKTTTQFARKSVFI